MIKNFSNSANDEIAKDLYQVSTVEAPLPLPTKKVAVFSNTGPDQIKKSIECSVVSNIDDVAKEIKQFMQGKQRNELSGTSSLAFLDAHSASAALISEVRKSAPVNSFKIQSESKVDVVHTSSTFQSNVLNSTQRPVPEAEKRQKKIVANVPTSTELAQRLTKKNVPQAATENKASVVIQNKDTIPTHNIIRNPKKTVLVLDKPVVERCAKKMVTTAVKEAVNRPAKKMTDGNSFSGDHIFQHPKPPAVRSSKKTITSSASSSALTGANPKAVPPPPPSSVEGAGSRRPNHSTTHSTPSLSGATTLTGLYSPRGRGPAGAGVASIVLC